MAETITVAAEIDSRGARTGAMQFNGALKTMRSGVASTGRALTGLVGQFFSLRGAIAGAVGAFTGGQLVEAADNFSLLQSRLKLVAQEGTTVESLMGGIADAAARANRPVADLTQLYTRNAKSLEAMGKTQGDGIRIAETLAKALTISGTSATEAAGGLRQLSQAIASGAFRGDEFNSVAENIPEVMRILQRETGKTAGELRKLASEGKLTSEVLVNSMLNASAGVDRAFAQMEQTSGQSWSVMVDFAAQQWGKIADGAGVSEAWAEAWGDIRNAMAGPEFQTAAEFVAEMLANTARGVSWLAENVSEARIQYEAWMQAISETTVYKTVAAGIELVGDAFGWISSQAKAAREAIASLDPGSPLEGGIDALEARVKQIADEKRRFGMFAASAQGLSGLDNLRASEQTERLPITFGSGEADAQSQKRAERLTSQARERLEIQTLRNQLLQAEIAGETTQISALENQLAMRRASSAELEKVSPGLARQLEGQALVNEELRRQVEMQEEARDLGERFGRTLTDAFTSAIREGKNLGETLRGVAAQLVEMVAQAAIIDPLVKGLGKGFAGAFGGGGSFDFSNIGSSIASAFMPFADGGVIGSPVAFAGAGVRGVIGEAGPEAVLPLRRGPGGRLGVLASGTGGNVTTVNISIAGDATDATIEKMRRVAQQEFARGTPGLVNQSVEAVRVRNHRDRTYLAR